MTFIDQRLPQQLELGVVRRERESLDIVRTDGGYEVRNARHSQALYEYDISLPPGEFDDAWITELEDMFKASRGGLYPFRFRDWDSRNSTLQDEVIGTGDGADTTFQITRTVTVGGVSAVRNITRPVSTITVMKDGVVQTSGVSVNYSTGLVTFTSAPALGVVISVSGIYDIPVRFDQVYEATALTQWLKHGESVTLLEVKE